MQYVVVVETEDDDYEWSIETVCARLEGHPSAPTDIVITGIVPLSAVINC